jgi:hypothetical protein
MKTLVSVLALLCCLSAVADDSSERESLSTRLLKESDVLFEARRYDLALKKCNEVLEADPSYVPALKQKEKIKLYLRLAERRTEAR